MTDNTRGESAPQARKPWFPFYPADWRGDAGLRNCSLAARGLWVEMLAVMHDAPDRGYLMVGNSKMSISKLAIFVGADLDRVRRLLAELAENGVFSTDETGRIYSRKMVRSSRRSETNSANANQRWNTDNPGEIDEPKSGSDKVRNAKAKPISSHVRDRDLRDSESQRGSVSNDTGDERLESLLNGEEKFTPGNSKDAWAAARYVLTTRGNTKPKSAGGFIGNLIKAGISTDKLFEIAQAAWLAGSEEPEALMTATARNMAQRASGGGYRGQAKAQEPEEDILTPADQRQYLAFLKRRNELFENPPWFSWDYRRYGPHPGKPNCKFDDEILREFGIEPPRRPVAG